MENYNPTDGIRETANTPAPIDEKAAEAAAEDLLSVDAPDPGPEPEPPVTVPSRISRRTLTIGLICLAVLLLAAGAFLMTKLIRHPLQRAVAAARDTLQEMREAPLGQFAKNLRNSGSMSLRVDLTEMPDLVSQLMPLPIKLDAAAELTAYSKNGSLALTADGFLKGKSLLDAKLVYNEGKDIAVSSDIFFGKTNYGLNLKTLSKNLDGSVFDPAKGGAYALPQETFDQLKATEFKEHELEDLTKESKDRVREFTNAGIDYLIKNAKFETGSQTITIAGETIKTNTLTVLFNEEILCGLFETLIDYCRGNEQMIDFLDRAFGKFQFLVKTPTPGTTFRENLLAGLDDLKAKLPELKTRLAGTDFTAIAYMKDGRMLRVDGRAVKGGQEAFCSFSLGPDVKAPREITMDLSIPGHIVASAVYEITSRTEELYSSRLTVRSDAADLATLTLSWDKKSGALSLLLQDLQGSRFASLNAVLLRDGKITKLDLKKVSYSDGTSAAEYELPGVHVTCNEAAEFPVLPNFTEITSLSEEQVKALVEDLQKTFSSLFSLSSLLGQ